MHSDLLLAQLDHLVFAAPDLMAGIEHVERLLGVRPEPGGRHPGWGTRNALVALGPGRYLEVIGPDPEQPDPKQGRPFGIDTLREPRLVRWAAKGTHLGEVRAAALNQGIDLGVVRDGRRTRPDGVVVKWQLTDPWVDPADGLIPFLIDWGDSPHPSASIKAEANLVGLRAEHPEPERIRMLLKRLNLHLPVTGGPQPKLVAVIEGKLGRVELA